MDTTEKPTTEVAEADKPVAREKPRSVSHWARNVAVAFVTACVPVLINGYYSDKANKREQEAGWSETKKVVDELQEQMKDLVKEVSYLKGRSDQRSFNSMHEGQPLPAPQFRKMPARFEDVVKAAK